jgi:endoglucanase
MRPRTLGIGFVFVIAAILLSSNIFAASTLTPFAENQRVVFFGDSITHGSKYVGMLQLLQVLRNPGCGTVFMSAGLSGDTAGRSLKRFQRDVADKKPDRVCVMFGMNDVGHYLYVKGMEEKKDTKEKRLEVFKNYEKNMRSVAKLIDETGAEITFITPTPYDEYSENPKKAANKDCNEYGLYNIAKIVRKLAAERKTVAAELFDPFVVLMKKHLGRFQADRVHPGMEGHLIMAAMIFSQTGVSPYVANCEIKAKDLPYTYRPKAFPVPVDSLYRKVEEVYPITEKLNQEMFKVKGLKKGTWTLCIDSKPMGDFTADELAGGVNLALLPTPNQLEAQRLARVSKDLIELMSRMCTYFAMFDRVISRGGQVEDRESAFSTLDGWVKEMQDKKVSTAAYYANCVKSFKKTYDERSAIEQRMEKLRQELNAARPKSCVISLVAK